MKHTKINTAILLAVLAAALYAVSTPVSKMLLTDVPPTMVAAFLYLGAGTGMGVMMVARRFGRITRTEWRVGRGGLFFLKGFSVGGWSNGVLGTREQLPLWPSDVGRRHGINDE